MLLPHKKRVITKINNVVQFVLNKIITTTYYNLRSTIKLAPSMTEFGTSAASHTITSLVFS